MKTRFRSPTIRSTDSAPESGPAMERAPIVLAARFKPEVWGQIACLSIPGARPLFSGVPFHGRTRRRDGKGGGPHRAAQGDAWGSSVASVGRLLRRQLAHVFSASGVSHRAERRAFRD